VAVWKGNYDMVNSLLEKGADPNIQNEKGETPLDFAKSSGFEQILVRLQTKESSKHASEVLSPLHRGGKRNKKRNRTIKRKKNQ
jgi:ankyrin repeat protein